MAKKLWEPSEEQIKSSNMYAFMTGVNKKYGTDCSEYNALWDWSVNHIPEFWAEMWDFAGIKASTEFDEVVDDVNQIDRKSTRLKSSHYS